MANESLFTILDRKAKEHSERQREKKRAQINQKIEKTKNGEKIL